MKLEIKNKIKDLNHILFLLEKDLMNCDIGYIDDIKIEKKLILCKIEKLKKEC